MIMIMRLSLWIYVWLIFFQYKLYFKWFAHHYISFIPWLLKHWIYFSIEGKLSWADPLDSSRSAFRERVQELMALHGDQEKDPQQPKNPQPLEDPQEHQVPKESKDSQQLEDTQELQIPEELKEPQQPQHQQLKKTVDLSSQVDSDPTWCKNTSLIQKISFIL